MAGRYDDLINLSIGDPDIKTPQRVVELAFADALAGHTKYTDPQGYPELREEIRAFYREEYGIPVKDEEVFVSSSGLTAMYLAMAVTLDPGDEVIVPDPFFTCYQGQIEAAGGVVVPLPTCREEGFGISLERLEGLVTPRTKGILLNPTIPPGPASPGRSWSRSQRSASATTCWSTPTTSTPTSATGSPFSPCWAFRGWRTARSL